MHYVILNVRKLDKPKLRNILQNNCPVIFKSGKVTKVKENLMNYSRSKATKEAGQPNATCDPELF